MPTYEYACRTCGHHLEVVQSFSDDPLTDCPSCERGELRKVFSSIGITFKGSGFYKTDSRSSSKSVKKESAGASGAKDASGSKKDSAPTKSDSATSDTSSSSAAAKSAKSA